MYNQNSDLMKQEKFMLPTMIEGDFSAEELAEDADGLQMSFQRVKIPAGGTLQFEMPSDDPDNPDYEKTLVGVILHNHATCAYWPAGSEYDDDTTPLCSSVDGKVGIGTPGGACAACVMNRFGSAPDGSKGKACKNMRVLYLLRSGEYMPLQVNLPPTSIKPFKEFLNRAFMLRRRATYGSIVQIGLKRENNGTNDYSVATFKLLQDFQGKELAQIRAYANSFKEQIKLLLQQRAEITEEQRDTGCDYVIEPGAMTNEPADGHYIEAIANEPELDHIALPPSNASLSFPDLEIRLKEQTVSCNGQLVTLTHHEFAVLAYLARHPDWVFSASQIYEAVWDRDGEHRGTAVASVIDQIRRKLTPDTPKGGYIRTVLGSGYKFNSSPF